MSQFIRRFLGFSTWKPSIDDYRELRALKFYSHEDVDNAIRLLHRGKLRDCPYDLVGDNTIIVPVEAVKYFKKAGLEISKDTKVLSASELSPEERYRLRMEQGTF